MPGCKYGFRYRKEIVLIHLLIFFYVGIDQFESVLILNHLVTLGGPNLYSYHPAHSISWLSHDLEYTTEIHLIRSQVTDNASGMG
jgi:hypothetical protein